MISDRLRAAALLVALGASACSLWGSAPEQKPAGIVVAPGETFTIDLDANHSTGFQWELAKEPSSDVVTLSGTTYKQEPGAAIGAGGKEIWTFAAVAPGWTRMQFVYRRPWEEMAPARIAAYSIDVR